MVVAPKSNEWNGTGSTMAKTGRMVTYNRLVRDRVPEILESMGNIAVWRELNDESFAQALLELIVLASQRFSERESLESLSDLLDAIDAWLKLRGLSMEDVCRARGERRKRCGGYERRRYLQVVAGPDAADSLPRKDLHC